MANAETNNEALKAALYKEVELQLDLAIHGVSVDEDEVSKLTTANARELPGASPATPLEYNFVNGKVKGLGFDTGFQRQENSIYGLEAEEGKPVIYRYGKNKTRIGEIEFRSRSRHPLLEQTTRDGVPFHTIAALREDGQ
ncbi:MAG: hypothetical protein FDX18_11500, partial [Chlorobium sp.]